MKTQNGLQTDTWSIKRAGEEMALPSRRRSTAKRPDARPTRERSSVQKRENPDRGQRRAERNMIGKQSNPFRHKNEREAAGPSAIPRCARPSTGKASKPASAKT